MNSITPVAFGWSADALSAPDLRQLVSDYCISRNLELPEGLRAIIDARGTRCPYPVSALRRGMGHLKNGESLVLLTDDPLSPLDVELAVMQAGNYLRQRITIDAFEAFLVQH